MLNKLTPQNFENLVSSERSLSVDTEEYIRAMVDLTFEKAISEPGYSCAYARLCNSLSSVSGAHQFSATVKTAHSPGPLSG